MGARRSLTRADVRGDAPSGARRTAAITHVCGQAPRRERRPCAALSSLGPHALRHTPVHHDHGLLRQRHQKGRPSTPRNLRLPFRCNATGQHGEARPDELCPGGRALKLRRHIMTTQNVPTCCRQDQRAKAGFADPRICSVHQEIVHYPARFDSRYSHATPMLCRHTDRLMHLDTTKLARTFR
jgi:hypothetical protein